MIIFSKIVWSNLILPDPSLGPIYFKSDFVPNFPQDIPVRTLEIDHTSVELPSSISRRSLSRSGVLLNLVCLPVLPLVEELLAQDRFSLGIYGAIEPGPTDFNVAQSLSTARGEVFTKKFRAEMSPKAYFYSMPNMPVAQVAIYLNSQGRATAYTHSQRAGDMAIDQAKLDLKTGAVKAALVCGAFSLENPFVVQRASRNAHGILCECAASVLMVSTLTEPDGGNQRQTNESYGCISGLVRMIQEHTF